MAVGAKSANLDMQGYPWGEVRSIQGHHQTIMKIDYAKTKATHAAFPQGTRFDQSTSVPPTLATAMIIFTLLVLIAGLFGYRYHRSHIFQSQTVVPLEGKTTAEFEFYQVLPEVQFDLDVEDPFTNLSNAHTQHVTSGYFIQAGSFRTQDQATHLVEALQRQQYQAFWQSTSIPNQGVWFRVYIGPYTTTQQAKGAQFRLDSQLVPESFIIHTKVRGVS